MYIMNNCMARLGAHMARVWRETLFEMCQVDVVFPTPDHDTQVETTQTM